MFFVVISRLARLTLFPYTTLFRSREVDLHWRHRLGDDLRGEHRDRPGEGLGHSIRSRQEVGLSELECVPVEIEPSHLDRKSTRLNSSHGSISYAVFCLKKKTIAVV